jgi:hypothetical protein
VVTVSDDEIITGRWFAAPPLPRNTRPRTLWQADDLTLRNSCVTLIATEVARGAHRGVAIVLTPALILGVCLIGVRHHTPHITLHHSRQRTPTMLVLAVAQRTSAGTIAHKPSVCVRAHRTDFTPAVVLCTLIDVCT